MMRIRRRWWWFGIPALFLASSWLLFARLQQWNYQGNLRLAQQEIANGQLGQAQKRLAAMAARSGAPGRAADYWLGVCEALTDRPIDALRAFSRLPEEYPFDPVGAYHEAKANLTQGKLHAAEKRLARTLAGGGLGLKPIRELLSHIYEIEVRFDDVKALQRAGLAEAKDPVRILKYLNNLDWDRLPYDGLFGTLEKAGELAPDDDRVWLGKARLAIEAGRWEEAREWLERCRKAGLADGPVWKAWIKLALGSGHPDEAVAAVRQLEPQELELAERFALRAWLHRQQGNRQGEASVLEQWLKLEPAATIALERLAELDQQGGQLRRGSDFRHRKAEVENSLAAYRDHLRRDMPLRTAPERRELARFAELAGRHHEARALLIWALQGDPGDRAARELLDGLDQSNKERQSALAADIEPWPEIVPIRRVANAQPGMADVGTVAFTDDAESVGLRFVYDNAETSIHQLPEPFGGGLGLLDYDGDGWLDVYCVQGGPFTPSSRQDASSSLTGDRLFHNRGDGTFEDVTVASGIARFPRDHGHGVAVGDVDGDGRPDVFVTRWRSYALYRNRGDGTFDDITDACGLGGRRDWPTSAAFADFDGDGDLDLYVCHYAAWDIDNPRICRDPNTKAYLNCNPLVAEALPDHLYRNDGGRFVDVTTEAGIVDRDGRGLGVVAADFDGDGRIDLFVANDSTANFLFRNQGRMRFEEVGHDAGVAGNASGAYQAGMGVAAGDLDGDGLLDVAVTNFYGESIAFYRNLGSGVFCDASLQAGLTVATKRLLGFGVSFLDVNNDGLLDLVSANGHVNDLRPNYPYRMPAQLLLGGKEGRLTDVSEQAGAPWKTPRMGRGLAVGDLDNDGRDDVLILSHNQPLAYLHNRTQGGRFLTLCLKGRKANCEAIGAKVSIVSGGRRQVAQRIGGGSYQSASSSRLHFGLGNADTVESIEVIWPSGHIDRYSGLRANAGYLLREDERKPSPLPGFPRVAPLPRARPGDHETLGKSSSAAK